MPRPRAERQRTDRRSSRAAHLQHPQPDSTVLSRPRPLLQTIGTRRVSQPSVARHPHGSRSLDLEQKQKLSGLSAAARLLLHQSVTIDAIVAFHRELSELLAAKTATDRQARRTCRTLRASHITSSVSQQRAGEDLPRCQRPAAHSNR